MNKTVIVGMSGGVDSSVAAYLLQRDGWDVRGVFMRNWEDESDRPDYRADSSNGCSWEDDFADVRAVCDQLGIPYSTFNFVEEYKELVFQEFVKELEAGRTPNPDIACNQEIKFRLFIERALALPDVTHVATGHYARVEDGELRRPTDSNKDQTYFLHRIDPDVLPQVLFPLQDLTKDKVRAIAQEQKFPNADKKDSTGICFIGDIDYNAFIDKYISKKPGAIVTRDGTQVGEHDGLHFFTIGQRKGIDIGGTGPYYVVEKDLKGNRLIVTNDSLDPALSQKRVFVGSMHWLVDTELPIRCQAQIRYRQKAQDAKVSTDGAHLVVDFDEPQRAVTSGQSAVLYDGDRVLGGGIIE